MRNTFDTILNKPYGRGFCHRCGNYQSHKLRWCKVCGDEFCQHKHTLLDVIKLAANIAYGNGTHVRHLRPAYVAAIYQRKIRDAGFSEKEFENYITQRMEINEG